MDRATQKQELTCQMDVTESASESVIAALATLSDSKQFSADEWESSIDVPTLYDAVDPDALDALFRGRNRRGHSTDHVTFAYGNYKIRVRRDGEITVTPAAVIGAKGTDE